MIEVIKNVKEHMKVLIKWIILSVIVGIICRNVGSLFHVLLDLVSKNFSINRNLLFLLPVGGVIIVFLYEKLDFDDSAGTNKLCKR